MGQWVLKIPLQGDTKTWVPGDTWDMTQTQNILSKSDLRVLGSEIATAIGVKTASPFIGTWLGRPGCSIEISLTSKRNGKRIVVHKWDDEETCTVTYNEGDFWRDPDNAHTFGVAGKVLFDANNITFAARDLLTPNGN